jgi:hypothetical protein
MAGRLQVDDKGGLQRAVVKSIAYAANSVEKASGLTEFLAEAAHMGVDGSRVGVGFILPNIQKQPSLRGGNVDIRLVLVV